jgi:hypothetical protein
VPEASLSGHSAGNRSAITCFYWRQGTSKSGDKAQGSLVYAFAVSPTFGSSGLKDLIVRVRRLIVVITLSLLLSQQLLTQTPTQEPGSGSSAAQTSGAPHNESAKTKCTDNGTYVNSKGQTVPRPENCSAPPKGATAQCRDGTYSSSKSRRGTCSHHGGVAKWL